MNMTTPKILIVPPCPWYMEAHAEYLIRYLSDEFFIEIADVPYPPYENFLSRYPETNPFQRNPDDYDLIVPLLATHWVITEREKYSHKVALIWYQPNEGYYYDNLAGIGATTPLAEESLKGKKYHSLRFGIDTELFKPIEMIREDDYLHIGVIGTVVNPRRMMREVILPLANLDGVRLMIFPTNWDNAGGNIGKEILPYVVTGNKYWPGLPNIYNRLDVLLRIESDPGYSFPVLEAAACGVPVIATNSGIDHFITNAGGGILIDGDRQYYQNNPEEVAKKVSDAVVYMRGNPEKRIEMGATARQIINLNWKWEYFVPAWRHFFREGVKKVNANRYS